MQVMCICIYKKMLFWNFINPSSKTDYALEIFECLAYIRNELTITSKCFWLFYNDVTVREIISSTTCNGYSMRVVSSLWWIELERVWSLSCSIFLFLVAIHTSNLWLKSIGSLFKCIDYECNHQNLGNCRVTFHAHELLCLATQAALYPDVLSDSTANSISAQTYCHAQSAHPVPYSNAEP